MKPRAEPAEPLVPFSDIERLIAKVTQGQNDGHAVTNQSLAALGAEYRLLLAGQREMADRLLEASRTIAEQGRVIAELQGQLLRATAEDRRLEIDRMSLELRDKRIGQAIEMGGNALALFAASSGNRDELKKRFMAWIEEMPADVLARAAASAPEQYRALVAACDGEMNSKAQGAPASEAQTSAEKGS